ncbi:uncharacterized protein YciI [Hydrogenophaga palleronii]|uniref:Uncharacterized protein YciI n=1 Tax=Hydrogenophaga palleronii TaxID=65655 RepID=A0ABU1WQJ2_9BURK|nr:hypothetical protein [Hydrogenophaga palleronii]MDR7151314.1 uncharacterized protein YciI [Hydrogenophaga palleronii]
MHIIFLKFGPNRAQAGQWMAEHKRWMQQGIDDGSFLMTGSLDNAQGGAVLAANMDRETIQQRVDQDPFVIHQVVTAEIHTVAPSLLAQGMVPLLQANSSPTAAS